jgi:hypothetical protein
VQLEDWASDVPHAVDRLKSVVSERVMEAMLRAADPVLLRVKT